LTVVQAFLFSQVLASLQVLLVQTLRVVQVLGEQVLLGVHELSEAVHELLWPPQFAAPAS